MSDPSEPRTAAKKPAYVIELESVYGPPSQEGFGGAVFFERLPPEVDLEEAALAKYRYFVGGLWERFGQEAWLGPWKEVYRRPAGVTHDLVAELRAITDRDARSSVPLVLDAVSEPEKAKAALAAAYDPPGVTDLAVYTLGDGEAMSGLLIAGCRQPAGEATFLAALLD